MRSVPSGRAERLDGRLWAVRRHHGVSDTLRPQSLVEVHCGIYAEGARSIAPVKRHGIYVSQFT